MKKFLIVVLLFPCLTFAQEKGAVVGKDIVTILPTAVPTAFSTPQFANTTRLSSAFVRNSTDIEVGCAFSGATAPHFVVPAGSTWWQNFGANDEYHAGPIGCIRFAATPASGNIIIGGTK